uniref:Uncharacterized protein n=1 Tax=Daucus carota subsp. sativus TaxID=79200 RepID=A0A164Y9Z4_DAUCS
MPTHIVGSKMEDSRLFDAVNVLLSLQSKNGGLAAWEPAGSSEWLEEITGVFMKNCMLHYAAYRNIYPLWAIAEYRKNVQLPSTSVEVLA